MSNITFGTVTRRCCKAPRVEDSHCETMQLDEHHEQANTRPLPHDELVQLHCFASLRNRGSLLVWLDREMTWLAPHDGSPGRPAVFSDAAIQFCLTITAEAAQGRRCTASNFWANVWPPGTSTVRSPNSRSVWQS